MQKVRVDNLPTLVRFALKAGIDNPGDKTFAVVSIGVRFLIECRPSRACICAEDVEHDPCVGCPSTKSIPATNVTRSTFNGPYSRVSRMLESEIRYFARILDVTSQFQNISSGYILYLTILFWHPEHLVRLRWVS